VSEEGEYVERRWEQGSTYARKPDDLVICGECYCVVPVWFSTRHGAWHDALSLSFTQKINHLPTPKPVETNMRQDNDEVP